LATMTAKAGIMTVPVEQVVLALHGDGRIPAANHRDGEGVAHERFAIRGTPRANERVDE